MGLVYEIKTPRTRQFTSRRSGETSQRRPFVGCWCGGQPLVGNLKLFTHTLVERFRVAVCALSRIELTRQRRSYSLQQETIKVVNRFKEPFTAFSFDTDCFATLLSSEDEIERLFDFLEWKQWDTHQEPQERVEHWFFHVVVVSFQSYLRDFPP